MRRSNSHDFGRAVLQRWIEQAENRTTKYDVTQPKNIENNEKTIENDTRNDDDGGGISSTEIEGLDQFLSETIEKGFEGRSRSPGSVGYSISDDNESVSDIGVGDRYFRNLSGEGRRNRIASEEMDEWTDSEYMDGNDDGETTQMTTLYQQLRKSMTT
ncbi:uncharacterized protein LOC100165191 [Acyrthosiphon pisum]|uniref:Uncharacterized protein n=1 Tax=Acyrthosiphon pisum TaxID=7029 RepID=A0A8R2A9V5_ACYPI|nr:uncharacterized protein LOC100165191 [Acyrthosiphon pisum]|eukprot:XP_001943492.1 PREDICTED: uncharacterized protein LOC100165191 [Acyrthosiphon pisum]